MVEKPLNPMFIKDIMGTKTLVFFYLFAKLLFLAVFFTRLEGRRLLRRRVRA
jgi:hypothetical protein